MFIDTVFAVLMGLAIFKGYRKGLIVAVFSLAGFIVGLAAALKLSAFVSVKLSEGLNTDSRWLPFISFILVFVAVAFLVNMGARFIQKTFEAAMLGWVNRIGGILLFALLYSIVFSIFLFYAAKMNLLGPQSIAASQVYPYIEPLAPMVINSIGKIIPVFKDVFGQLEHFFEKLPAKLQ
ncbi:MAG: CvpA family protein [Ferruginibacter sp.]